MCSKTRRSPRGCSKFLSRQAAVLIITTPERDLVRGIDGMVAPDGVHWVREWSTEEFHHLINAHRIEATFVGFAANDDKRLKKDTIIVVCDHRAPKPLKRIPEQFRPFAIISTYNESDIAPQTVAKLLDEDFDVHALDNWSTDKLRAEPERRGRPRRNRAA
jgi:hypothetical protein